MMKGLAAALVLAVVLLSGAGAAKSDSASAKLALALGRGNLVLAHHGLEFVQTGVNQYATTRNAGHHRFNYRLALVPLQTAQLGAAHAGLALNYGSGRISNRNGRRLVGISFLGTGDSRAIGGYALDYGDPFTGSTGVMEIRSGVEEYKTRGGARSGLLVWQLEDSIFRLVGSLSNSGPVTVTEKELKAPAVGQSRFADLITLSAENLNPIVLLDEHVTAGRYVLDLTVTAGSASAAEHLAPHLLHVLRSRLVRVLGGHAAGKPAKLPPRPKAGQAAGGPDLSTLILQPPDVGQPHAVNLSQRYIVDQPALSAFTMSLHPAGTYDELYQAIEWWPTATEATYALTYRTGFTADFLLAFGATPVDLSAVGDAATGYFLIQQGESLVYVTLTNGQASESVFAYSDSALQDSDVQNLAQAAADRLDAGLGP